MQRYQTANKIDTTDSTLHTVSAHAILTGGDTEFKINHDFNDVICSKLADSNGLKWQNDITVRIPIAIFCHYSPLGNRNLLVVDSLVYTNLLGPSNLLSSSTVLQVRGPYRALDEQECVYVSETVGSGKQYQDLQTVKIGNTEMVERFNNADKNRFSKDYSLLFFDSNTIALLVNCAGHWSLILAFNINLKTEAPGGEQRLFLGIDFLCTGTIGAIIHNSKK